MKPWQSPKEEEIAINAFIDSLKEICPSCENEVELLYECWVDFNSEHRRTSFVCRDCLNKNPEWYLEIL